MRKEFVNPDVYRDYQQLAAAKPNKKDTVLRPMPEDIESCLNSLTLSSYYGELEACTKVSAYDVALMPTFTGGRPVRGAVQNTVDTLNAVCIACPVFEHYPRQRKSLPCGEFRQRLLDKNVKKKGNK